MYGRPTNIIWLDPVHLKPQAAQKELTALKRFQPLYGVKVTALVDPLEKFETRQDYILICSSEMYKIQSDMFPPKVYNLLGIIIYCHKISEHKRLERQKYVLLVTNSFDDVQRQIIAVLEEGSYDFQSVRLRADAQVEEQQNRFLLTVDKKYKQTTELHDLQGYDRRQRSILELFRMDFDIEKNLEKTKNALQNQLKAFFKETGVTALDKEFQRIRKCTTLSQLVRQCLYLYTLQRGHLYQSLNILLKNLRMIRFQNEFKRLRIFAFLMLLNYFYFYGECQYHSTVYRFTDYIPGQELQPDSTFTICNFYSTSTEEKLETFKEKPTKIVIECFDHGAARHTLAFFGYTDLKNVSAYKNQNEVLFAPFTKFKIIKVAKEYGKNIIYMRELPSNNFISKIYDINLLQQNEETPGKLERELNYQFKYEKMHKGKQCREVATIYSNLGSLYVSTGQHDKWAQQYLTKALNMWQKLKDQKQQATVRNNFGMLLARIGKHSQALEQYRLAKETRLKAKEDDKKQRRSLVSLLNNQASLLQTMNKDKQSLQVYEQALTVCKDCFPFDHVVRGKLQNNIGYIYGKMSNYELALQHYQTAMSIYEKVEGRQSQNISVSLENIADTYVKMGKIQKAMQTYLEAIEIQKLASGTLSPNLQNMFCSLARLHNQRRQYQKSKEYLLKGLEICTQCFGSTHYETAMMYNNLGSVEESLGNPQQAIIYFQKSLDILYLVFREKNQDMIDIVSMNLSDLKEKMKDGVFAK